MITENKSIISITKNMLYMWLYLTFIVLFLACYFLSKIGMIIPL